jgi:hypothetical protein
LLGSHIFALSSGDIVAVLGVLVLPSAAASGGDDDGNCCRAYTWVLLQIAKTSIPTRNENTIKIKISALIILCMIQYFRLEI